MTEDKGCTITEPAELREILMPPLKPATDKNEKTNPAKRIENIFKFLNRESNKENNTKIVGIPKLIISYLVQLLLLLIFIASLIAFGLMWFTSAYNDSFLSELKLIENSTVAEWWATPPIKPILNVYVFNYTNVDRFLARKDDKLIVEELGPYVYRDTLKKVDVVFHDNDTVSYREFKNSQFESELSSGTEDDRIRVPNIPILAGLKKVYGNMVTSFGLSTYMIVNQVDIFKDLTIKELLWGYDDPLVEMANKLSFGTSFPSDKFGVLVNRNGTNPDVMNINAGVTDINRLGIISNLNGKAHMNYWSTEECNNINGTDGSQFPPFMVDKKHVLQVYIKEFCRKFDLVYEKEIFLKGGLPAWHYKAPNTTFADSISYPKNKCYCDKVQRHKCPKSGLFDFSVCSFEAPVLVSFPHFLYGDKSLFSKIDGLSPDPEKHTTFANIHSRLAFPIDGASRFQINVQIYRNSIVPVSPLLKDELVLPVLWLEIIPGELPKNLFALIYHTTFSANAMELCLKNVTMLAVTVSFVLLLIGVYCHYKFFLQTSRTSA